VSESLRNQASLESVCTLIAYRGFESHPVRWEGVIPFALNSAAGFALSYFLPLAPSARTCAELTQGIITALILTLLRRHGLPKSSSVCSWHCYTVVLTIF